MLYLLPGRSSHKVSVQQPQFAEQNPVDKRHGGQLLQGQLGLKLEFLLFHEERHGLTAQTCLKLTAKPNLWMKRRDEAENKPLSL